MPRRRRGAKAVAVEADAERGLAMRILLHSPKDTVAAAFAFAAICAIIANALFLQAGRHPSPMFGSVVAIPAAALAPASPLPRPRPVEADASAFEPKFAEPKLAEPKFAEPRPAEPKPADPLTNLVKATSAAPAASSGGAARAHRIWLRPVEADRHGRLGDPGRDPEVRAGAQNPGDRANVRSSGARTDGGDRPADRVAWRFGRSLCPRCYWPVEGTFEPIHTRTCHSHHHEQHRCLVSPCARWCAP